MEISQLIATVLLILANGLVALILSRYLRLPFTLCVLLCGIAWSFLIPWTGFDTGIRADNFQDLIMYVLVPVLVFEAALNLDTDILRPVLASILFSASIGMVIATGIAAVIIFYAIGYPLAFPWIAALLTGLVISSTDPVAVTTQLKDLKAPEQLATLLEGESLFNDAVALVIFAILLEMALGEAPQSWQFGLASLATVFAGGLLVGLGCALLARGILLVTGHASATFVIVGLALAYGSFYIAEHLLEVSGVIAVLFAALGTKRVLLCEKSNQHEVHHTWELFAFICNLVVFFFMGLVVTPDMFTEQWLAMLIGIAAAFFSRLVSSYASLAIGKWVFRNPLQWRYGPVMVWGGLRGVVTLALVLSLPLELDYWWTIQSMGFGVVLFTLLIQAPTHPWLLHKLKLSQQTA